MFSIGGGLNSAKMTEAMKDPEIKAFMDKVTKKLGPIMGMMGGGAGGMGGMGGMGGFPSPPPSSAGRGPTFEEEVD